MTEKKGPDAIWAPWRLQYLETLDDQPAEAPGTKSKKLQYACFLDEYWAHPEDDTKHHVIVRTDTGMILLNAYPYANGHLLVALGRGCPRLLDYTPEERTALWQLAEHATDLMERTLSPQGVNLGINQGRAAGAGVPGHLHLHLVPRWSGDVNFSETVAGIRVIPSSLEAMAQRYRKTRDALYS
jgi:ATP adenylyltransferase